MLEALEYLLQLMYRRAIEPRRLVVDCEGYRSDRDRALHDEALALAAAVAGDGVPRKMRALNSYERRVVHAALTGHPAVHTFSVGEGSERRVTVAPQAAGGRDRGLAAGRRRGEHAALAAGLGLDPAAAARLARYLDLLAAWNARTNLTAARTAAGAGRPPRAAGRRPGRRACAAGSLLDIGSGNGSPGLVLAALRPDVQATLLEPRQRRWAFLREAARAMGLAVTSGGSATTSTTGPPAATVTVRALRLPAGEPGRPGRRPGAGCSSSAPPRRRTRTWPRRTGASPASTRSPRGR